MGLVLTRSVSVVLKNEDVDQPAKSDQGHRCSFSREFTSLCTSTAATSEEATLCLSLSKSSNAVLFQGEAHTVKCRTQMGKAKIFFMSN